MRGEVTFKLIDTKSGVVKKTAKYHNMVTKAVENLINENTFRALNGYALEYKTWQEAIIKDLFGGIMLFDENISTSHLCPSVEDALHMIGIAGQYTSLNIRDKKNGTLQSAIITDDTATFTWNFADDACIGDIKAVCLTNKYGAGIGCLPETIDRTHINNSFASSGIAPTAILSYASPIVNIIGGGRNGLCILDGDTFVYAETVRNGGAYDKNTYDLSGYLDNKLRMDMTSNTPYVMPTVTSQQLSDDYKDLQGILCDSALQAYCISSTSGDLTTYTLKVRKHTISGFTDYDVPMTNLIQSVQNRYAEVGLTNPLSPIEPADILAGINSAIDNDLVFSHEGKLVWFIGYLNAAADIKYVAMIIQELDGSFVIYDVNQADANFYNMLLQEGSEFSGLLRHKTEIVNNIFETAKIEGDLYMTGGDGYYLVNTGNYNDLPQKIMSRPFYFVYQGNNYFKVADIDNLAKSPYYKIAGVSRWRDSDNRAFYKQLGCNVFRTNYFATIQNLDVPFAKTASDTLQVVYQLSKS